MKTTNPRTTYLLLLLCVVPSIAWGQVNTERMRALDLEGFRSTLGGDVVVESGHAELFEVGANLRFDFRRAPHYAFTTGEVRYGTKDGDPYRDRMFGHLRYNYRLLPWLVGELFTQLQRDGFARLHLRVLAGGGLRIQYLDGEHVNLFQGTTPMYEYENLNQTPRDAHSATVSTARWSNYLNVRLQIAERTHGSATVYVQPRFDAWDDVRVLNQLALTVHLTDAVRLTTEFNLNYDSRPPGQVAPLDLALRNGLQVSF